MINAIGNFCIFTSLAASVVGIFFAWRERREWIERISYLNFVLMTVATVGMVIALLTNDFSVSYVAQVGARETPRFFAAISLWSSLEGSILLWGWVLSGYTAICTWRHRGELEHLIPSVHLVLFAIAVFFYLVLAFPANPFHWVNPVPENGPGPNPLLQNHWLMGFHPPLLYLGYVGMSVPFAFAVASLINGNLTSEWITMTRRWFLLAWMFLSSAIVLGAWWSYAVLGWGGYWAWDPVENASFMPWLVGTAFLHSIMVEERREMLKIWNLILIVTVFLLTLLGTFLTRSGILDSVHSFTESAIGHYFLVAMAVALVVSVALLLWRGPLFRSIGRFDHPFCRESAFLLNNLLFLCFCFVVLLGTLYPLIVEAVRGIKISVGAPFFNEMAIPLTLAIILLMGVGVVLPWRRAVPEDVVALMKKPLLMMLVVTALAYTLGVRKILVLLTVALAGFTFSIMLFEMIAAGWRSGFQRIFLIQPRRYGGFVAHIGILVLVLGIAFSGNYQSEKQISLKKGEAFQMGAYRIELVDVYGKEKPQRFELTADLQVSKKGEPVAVMKPKLNFYPNNREPIGSPAIRSTLLGDLYLTLMAFEHDSFLTTFRVLTTPGVIWIWIGGGIIVLGIWICLGFKGEKI